METHEFNWRGRHVVCRIARAGTSAAPPPAAKLICWTVDVDGVPVDRFEATRDFNASELEAVVTMKLEAHRTWGRL